MSLLNMKRLHSLCKDKELSAFAGSSSSLNILPIFNPSLIYDSCKILTFVIFLSRGYSYVN